MALTHTPRSVTRLTGLGLTAGKLRGLQRISNDNGTLTMVATDQNSSMIKMIKDSHEKKGEPAEASYEEIVEAKVMLARALGPHCSGLLVDSVYGYWNSIASYAIPANTGTLIRVEKSGGPKNDVGAPLGEVEAGWSVEKIKRCGADAVKLLAQFEPHELGSAEHQFELIRKVYDDCVKHDILLLLEPVAFPYGSEKKDDPAYLDRKAETVIQTARYISQYCDVYKAEFPGTSGRDSDAQLVANLKELDRLCPKPWVLLSAGVDYDTYKGQVAMAMESGASGVLGGRAFWKEFFTHDAAADRQKFAETTCVERVRQVDGIVKSKATPWFAKYELKVDDLHNLRAAEGWQKRYAGSGAAKSSDIGPDPDAVY